MEKKTANYNFSNMMRFIFSIVVIGHHTKTLTFLWTGNNYIDSMMSIFLEAGLPFFFLNMGYSLAEKINFYDCKTVDLLKIKYVLKGTIKEYIKWSIVYLPLAIVEYIQTGNSPIYSFFSYLKGFFFKGEHYNSWMLWFLLSFIYSLGFIYLLLKKKINFKKISIISIFIGMFSIVLAKYNIYEFQPSSTILKYLLLIIKHTIDNGRILTGFLYVSIGIILEKTNIEIIPSIILAVLCVMIYCVSGMVIKSICSICFSSLFLLICLDIKLSNKYDRICNILKELSTTNYYLHMYAFTLFYFVVYGEPAYTIGAFICTTLLTLTMGIIYLLYKNRKAQKQIN